MACEIAKREGLLVRVVDTFYSTNFIFLFNQLCFSEKLSQTWSNSLMLRTQIQR